jgi:hypothetical protein
LVRRPLVRQGNVAHATAVAAGKIAGKVRRRAQARSVRYAVASPAWIGGGNIIASQLSNPTVRAVA